MRRVGFITWIVAALAFGGCTEFAPCRAEPAAAERHVPTPTLGGKQVWADQLFFHQWRIQRSALSGSHRLLDENDFCHATGTFASCCEVLEQIKHERRLPPMQGSAVLVLHGLFRTRNSMGSLCAYLQRQGGYRVLNVEYPSTLADVAEHAKGLASIVEHLEGIEEIHLVGHSLGNIVIRRWLADWSTRSADQQAGPRLGRLVMIGPPNQGARLATAMANEPLFRAVAGKAGQQLGSEWPWLAITLKTPPCEFGVIAGGLENEVGFNPLLAGDDDGTITVESTRLEGAKDFLIVPRTHSGLIENRRVFEQTLLFLQEGHFEHRRD